MYGMYRWPLCMIVQIKPCGFVDPTWRSCCAYVTILKNYSMFEAKLKIWPSCQESKLGNKELFTVIKSSEDMAV